MKKCNPFSYETNIFILPENKTSKIFHIIKCNKIEERNELLTQKINKNDLLINIAKKIEKINDDINKTKSQLRQYFLSNDKNNRIKISNELEEKIIMKDMIHSYYIHIINSDAQIFDNPFTKFIPKSI